MTNWRVTSRPSARAKHPAMLASMRRANTMGVREATLGAQDDMRDDVLSAGLGQRLANTVRAETYPNNGRDSLSPAGWIWVSPGRKGGRGADSILGYYMSGRPITPALGEALAIPTDKVPMRGGRGYRTPMSPSEVEATFGAKLYARRLKTGNIGLFIRTRRWRGKPQLMFVIVRNVPGRKSLDFASIHRHWFGRVSQLVSANFMLEGR